MLNDDVTVALASRLQARGWSRSGRRFHQRGERGFAMLQLQASAWDTEPDDEAHFYVNIGSYYPGEDALERGAHWSTFEPASGRPPAAYRACPHGRISFRVEVDGDTRIRVGADEVDAVVGKVWAALSEVLDDLEASADPGVVSRWYEDEGDLLRAARYALVGADAVRARSLVDRDGSEAACAWAEAVGLHDDTGAPAPRPRTFQHYDSFHSFDRVGARGMFQRIHDVLSAFADTAVPTELNITLPNRPKGKLSEKERRKLLVSGKKDNREVIEALYQRSHALLGEPMLGPNAWRLYAEEGDDVEAGLAFGREAREALPDQVEMQVTWRFRLIDPDTRELLPFQGEQHYLEGFGSKVFAMDSRSGTSIGLELSFPFEDDDHAFTASWTALSKAWSCRMSPKNLRSVSPNANATGVKRTKL